MSGGPTVELGVEACAIRTRGLEKDFGPVRALAGVDLEVPEGSVYLLVGPNGAGKTTLLRTLMGLIPADRGSLEVIGLEPWSQGARVRAGIGYVPEHREWGCGWMGVERLLEHHAAYYPAWDDEYAGYLARALELPRRSKYQKLSKGQARRVQLVMALSHRPQVLLLDEPTDALDPVARDETLSLLAEHLSATGATAVVCTHRVHEMERLADHVGVLRHGALRAQLPVEVLRRRLRRYRAQVPDTWSDVPALNSAVVRRYRSGAEIEWTVWGEEAEVVARLSAAGAAVREAGMLSLDEAAIVLLSSKEEEPWSA